MLRRLSNTYARRLSDENTKEFWLSKINRKLKRKYNDTIFMKEFDIFIHQNQPL